MAEGATRLSMAAPAKLNLWLSVVGRRPDGFHLLESVLVLLELADRVVLWRDGEWLRIGGPEAGGVPADTSNLAWRGLVAARGRDPGRMGLELHKQIPVAAGLGGGSSDAAAAWRLARSAAGHEDVPPDAGAMAVLSQIGADVPFFAAQAAVARVSGVGERVVPIGAKPSATEVVLAHPGFGLATGAVFAEVGAADWSESPESFEALAPGRNDLEAPARRLRSEIADVFRLVAGAGGEPHLTGSGPTVFALTDDPERADGIAARLQRAGLRATRTRLRREPARIQTVEEPKAVTPA